MNNLYTYLRNKLKSKDIHLEEFASLCGFSKSTLYRYMKGIQTMPAEVEQKICKLLVLTDYEKKELHEILNTTYIDFEILKVREAIYKLLFNSNKEFLNLESLELILYNGDRFIRTIEEIFDIIIKASSNEGFSCEIDMIGCINANIIHSIQKLINQNEIKNFSLKIEHIINIPNIFCSDIIHNINLLFPLFKFNNYDIFYSDCELKKSYLSIENDFIIIKYNHLLANNEIEENYIFISLLKDRFSGCYVSKDRNLYNFFIQNYISLKHRCKNSLIKFRNLKVFNTDYENIEKDNDIYSIQSMITYDKIPVEVLKAELQKYSDEQIIFLVDTLSNKKNTIKTAKEYISYIINYMDKKSHTVQKTKTIDIFNKEDIKKFVFTRRLGNGFLPFSKESICIIMNYLIKRNSDTEDNYYMYFSNNNMNSEIIVKIIKGVGLMIDYNLLQTKTSVDNLFIQNENICNMFANFVEDYIFTDNVMNLHEAYNYIENLLAQYCS